MGEYAQVVNQILNIAEYLENDKISLTDFPFDEIIGIIRQIYDVKYKKGDLFAKLYSCFLSRDRDKIDVVSALKLFAEYMLILEQNDVLFQKKNFEIHTIYPLLLEVFSIRANFIRRYQYLVITLRMPSDMQRIQKHRR